MTTAEGISFRVLGPLTALRDGEPVDLGAPKQRAVLALLLLHRGRIVSTDRLIDAVWGEAPPPSALASLQAYVSNLRRALRDPAGATTPIVRRAPGYVLDVAADRLDVAAFLAAADAAQDAAADGRWTPALEHADAALASWHGPLLEDLWDQPWLAAEAQPLDERRTGCRETRVTALLATGDVAQALAGAAALHADLPLSDRAAWLHVIALHRAGRSSQALEVHRAHVARLDEDLGLQAGAELRELQVAVLRHDPVLAAWPRPPGWTGADALQTPAVAPEEPPAAPEPAEEALLVGRDRELAILDAALADVHGGRTRWLVLTGEAGIGKTRLAEEACRRVLAAGGREVWARCPEDDGTPAGWPIRQLVRGLGEDPDVLLVPPTGADSDSARFATYERVEALLERTARPEAPVALVVDDVQWVDPGSARCLAYLAGALRTSGVLLVLTLRDGEDRNGLDPLLAALARNDGHRQVAVGPLGTADVARLAGRVTGAPVEEGEAGRLAARTGGNPLFVSEYARLHPEERRRGDLPLAVRAVVGRRLAGLDDPVMEVLRAAAVIGDALDVPLLAATTRLDPDELADRLDAAADEHVIVATPDTGVYAFAHGLLREAVLTATPALRRQRLHGRVAAALEDAADGDSVIRRAGHLVAAQPLADAHVVVAGCRAAALVAERRWTSDAAAEWWATAVRVLDTLPETPERAAQRDELLVARLEALARVGRCRTIVETVDVATLAAARAGRIATVGRLAGVLQRSAGAWPWLTVMGADAGPLTQRLDGLEALVADDPTARVALTAARAVGHCGDPDPARCDRLSTDALEAAQHLGDPDAMADALLGRLISYSGVAAHAAESVALCERLVALAHQEVGDDTAVANALAVMALMQLGDVAGVERALRDGISSSDRLRLVVVRVQLRWGEGMLAQWRGDLATASARAEVAGAVQAGTEFAYPGSLAIARASLARLDGTLATADPADYPEPETWNAAIAAARGDHDAATGLVTAWLDTPRPDVWLTVGHLALVADVAADLGMRHEVDRLLERLAPYAGQIAIVGHVSVIGPVDLIAGRLLALRGDVDAARERMEAALRLARATGGTPFAKRAEAALGALP